MNVRHHSGHHHKRPTKQHTHTHINHTCALRAHANVDDALRAALVRRRKSERKTGRPCTESAVRANEIPSESEDTTKIAEPLT